MNILTFHDKGYPMEAREWIGAHGRDVADIKFAAADNHTSTEPASCDHHQV